MDSFDLSSENIIINLKNSLLFNLKSEICRYCSKFDNIEETLQYICNIII